MNNAYLYAVLSLAVWSFYPVLTAYGILDIHPILFVVIVQFFAGLGSLMMSLPFLRLRSASHNIKRHITKMPLDAWIYLLLVGLWSALFNLFVVCAMSLIEPAAVAIIVQTSPILTMIFSTVLIRKKWNRIKLIDYVVAITTLCGAIIVIIGNPNSFNNTETELSIAFIEGGHRNMLIIAGGAIAFLAAMMLALSNAMRAQVSNVMQQMLKSEDVRGDKNIVASLVGESACRMASLIPALIIFLIWFSDGTPIEFKSSNFLAAAITGFFVFNIASAMLSVALLKAKSSSVTIVSFLGPVLSIFWLYLFGLSEITPLIIIGMFIIIISNGVLFKTQIPNQQ